MILLERLHALQLFADGGEGGGEAGAGVGAEGALAADAGQRAGVGAEGAPAVDAGQQEEVSFADLISGKYKADFEKEVSKIVRSRVKSAQDENKTLKSESEQWKNIGRYLQARYGDGNELTPQELLQHIEADDYYIEREADRNGITAKEQRRVMQERWTHESESEELARLRQEREDREYFTRMASMAPEIQNTYPDFDLRKELNNPRFMELTKAGMHPQEVYEMLHHKELLAAAEKKAAEASRESTAAAVASGASRPAEGTLSAGSAATQTVDPSKFTKEQREKIMAAALRGEKVGPGHPLWR